VYIVCFSIILSGLDIHIELLSLYVIQPRQRKRRKKQKQKERMITKAIPNSPLISSHLLGSVLLPETERSRNKENIYQHLLVEKN